MLYSFSSAILDLLQLLNFKSSLYFIKIHILLLLLMFSKVEKSKKRRQKKLRLKWLSRGTIISSRCVHSKNIWQILFQCWIFTCVCCVSVAMWFNTVPANFSKPLLVELNCGVLLSCRLSTSLYFT